LQTYVEKISGAKIPIVSEPSADLPIKIGVGRSPLTDDLKIVTRDLRAGAYRIVSGDDWLVLIGDDTDYQPIEPWPKNVTEGRGDRLQKEWEKISGGITGRPNSISFTDRLRLPGEIGLPTGTPVTGKIEPTYLWCFDERGSFNAVNGFLQSLGVRWYLRGEVGEVVPSMKSIPAAQDRFRGPARLSDSPGQFSVRGVSYEPVMWAMRLGLRDESGLQTAHGMHTMTHRDEISARVPSGSRFKARSAKSSRPAAQPIVLFQRGAFPRDSAQRSRAVRSLQTGVVSVMPPDGYGAICQCPLCEGKDAPSAEGWGISPTMCGTS